jgi:hypothetical protein
MIPATVTSPTSQAQGLRVEGKAIALITISGNDLLGGLIRDTGAGIATFIDALDRYGQLVDLHARFLKGDPSWFTPTSKKIERYIRSPTCLFAISKI